MKTIRPHHLFDAVVWTSTTMFLLVLGVHEAHAGEHRYDVGNPRYRSECGSCHLPYPPALMTVSQWQRVMSSLDRHYGVDASLDPQAAAQITGWLAAGAGGARDRERGTGGGLPRISTGRWFRNEHREVAARFGRGPVKSAADCGACHAGADRGDYEEATLGLAR